MQFGLKSCRFFLQITVVQTAGGSSPIKLFLQELFVMEKKTKTVTKFPTPSIPPQNWLF